MKHETFFIGLTEEERKRTAARYHFDTEQLSRIETLQEAALPLIRAQAWFDAPVPGLLKIDASCALCAVTLGDKFDALQELYGSAQAVSEEYMLECIGNALLEKACERLGSHIREETGLFLNACRFPGSHMPIEEMKDILDKLSAGEGAFPILCSEAYTLRPKKSVVFVGILGEDEAHCGICADCPRRDCDNRERDFRGRGCGSREQGAALSADTAAGKAVNYCYGYRKIFGMPGGEKK